MGRRTVKVLILGISLLAAAAPVASSYSLWGTDWGAGSTVTYSFDYAGGYTIDETFGGWGVKTSIALDTVFDAGWENDIRAAFNTWAAVIDIVFTEVADNGVDFNAGGATGDIRIASHIFDGAYSVLAHAYYPPPNGNTAAGDVHFDSQEPWHVGAGDPGGGEIDLFTVALHELGHSLGLAHSADPTAVMFASYWYNAAEELSADDIAGGQAIYGAQSGITPEPPTLVLVALAMAVATFMKARPSRVKPATNARISEAYLTPPTR